jgi:hypothetical protein
MSGALLASRLPAVEDDEGARVPAGLPPVVDAHVHVFPDRLFAAIRRWFDEHAWPIRYRLTATDVARFLLDRGVSRVVALSYAHRPGIARDLNAFVAEIARADPRVHGLATVFPGEPDALRILGDAFDLGLCGVKIHCHVQCVAPDDPALGEVLAACAARDLPVVMHAGRAPRSHAYRCDPYRLCAAQRVDRILRDHPRLRLCVPHLGADEFQEYERLVERHDHLWLDTTMMLAGYFPEPPPDRLWRARPERVMYGTDFPNIPYAWDRELRRLAAAGLGDEALASVLGGTAREFFRLKG